MANILIVTNYYYPKKSVGVNRMLAFEKYLKKFGHNVYVLTEQEKEIATLVQDNVYYVKKQEIFNRCTFNRSENKIWHYIKCAYNLLVSYTNLASSIWIKRAIKVAREIVNDKDIDVIISSYPGLESLYIANQLKKEKPSLRWIADMRDALWATSGPKFYMQRTEIRGKRLLSLADAVTSAGKIEDYQEFLEDNKDIIFRNLRNGFDFELTNNIKEKRDCMNIVFSGSFYGEIKPKNFFKALNNIINGRNINVTIIGNRAPINIPKDLREKVEEKDWMQYGELIKYLKKEADLLLMIIPKSREGGVFSGKIFDYIGCLKPILGLVPKDDVAAALLEETKTGYVAENEDIKGIERMLLQAYYDWENEKDFEYNVQCIKKYHREEQVKVLDEIIRGWM